MRSSFPQSRRVRPNLAWARGRQRGPSRRVLLVCATILSGCGEAARQLERGSPVEQAVTAGEAHSLRLELQAGQFVRLLVRHEAIDVTLQLLAPDGRPLSENRSFPSSARVQRLSVVTETGGRHRLDVHVLGEPGTSGDLVAEIDELRSATSQDGDRVAAERLFAAGYEQRLSSSPDAWRAAIGFYENALQAWRRSGDPNGQAGTLNAIGFAHRLLGEYDAAAARYEEALELWRQAGNSGGEVDTLNNLGHAQNRLGEYEAALATYDRALRRAAGDAARQARVLNNLAITYRELNRFDQALAHYQRAIELRRATGDTVGAARILVNLAVVYLELQEHRQALDVLHEAMPLLRQAGETRSLASALNSLGRTYAVLGQYERAVTYYAEALEIIRTRADERNTGRTLNNLGLALHFAGQPRQALASFEEALSLPSLATDARFEAAALQNAARSYRALGAVDTALAYSRRALTIRRAEGDLRGEAITLTEIAAIEVERDLIEAAVARLRRALAISRSVEDPRNEAVALLEWAGAERRRGNLSLALDRIETAIRIVESRRRKVSSPDQRASFLAAKRRFYALRIEVLMDLHAREPAAGYAGRALQANEQALARSLVDLLEDGQVEVDQRVDAGLKSRQREWQRLVNRLELERSRLARRQPQGADIAGIEERLIKALAELERLGIQIRGSSPAYAALTAPEPVRLRDIRRLLDPETLLLELGLGEERSFLWVVSPGGVDSYELPDRATIDAAALRVYELLRAREMWPQGEAPEQRRQRIRAADAAYPEAARALSEMLLFPAVESLAARRWLVVTEGLLSYVPFAALVDLGEHPASADGDADGLDWRPLITRHEIVRLPSASALLAMRRESPQSRAATRPLLVVADPIFSAEDPRVAPEAGTSPLPESPVGRSVREYLSEVPLRRLRFTHREAETAAAHVADGGAEVLLGLQATKAAVLNTLGNYRIVHFATHGVLNNRHPQLSALVLSLFDRQGRAMDGFLRLHDIYNLELQADLVVLSACQTALGKEIQGEGLVGLTRGFMYAGAPRVLATLWTVQDRASMELLDRFYQLMLGDGERPAAAIRQAQLALWQGRQFSPPYFWAGFELQGEWR